MKRIYFLCLIAVCFAKSAIGQPQKPCMDCLSNGITFSSQADIDNFQLNYPGCTRIAGGVLINGNSITNLNGLSVLTSVGGYLVICLCNNLTSLSGLSNVTNVGSYLNIVYCDALTSLTGLENLNSIAGNLTVSECNSLMDLTGLNNVTSIAGIVEISYSPLTSLTGRAVVGQAVIRFIRHITITSGVCPCTTTSACSRCSRWKARRLALVGAPS